MFGLGMPEILLILAIALIVIGPKKLPDLAKTLGRAMGEFKRSAQDFKRSIDVETTIKDIKDIEDPETDLKGIIKDSDIKEETPPDPVEDSGIENPDKEALDNASEDTSAGKGQEKADNHKVNNTND